MDATEIPAQRTADKEPGGVRCALYRFFAADDTLLYIGITQELPTRLRVHDRNQPWYHRVARVTVEHHETREAALAAEAAAIRVEKPRYNVIHNWGEGSAKPAGTRRGSPIRAKKADYEAVCLDLVGYGTGKLTAAKFLKRFPDGRMVRETQAYNGVGWSVAESVAVPEGPEREAAVEEFERLQRRMEEADRREAERKRGSR